jgi:hypothetical protein
MLGGHIMAWGRRSKEGHSRRIGAVETSTEVPSLCAVSCLIGSVRSDSVARERMRDASSMWRHARGRGDTHVAEETHMWQRRHACGRGDTGLTRRPRPHAQRVSHDPCAAAGSDTGHFNASAISIIPWDQERRVSRTISVGR